MRLRNCLGMIWSVSTSARSSTLTAPEMVVTGSISVPLPDVDEAALDGGRGGHLRGDQVRAPAPALPALEVAVRGRGAALARGEDVGVHAQAHGAARAAPVEAGRAEALVEALRLGLPAHLLGARHDHGVNRRGDPAALDDLGRGAQVADARVRAG